MPPAAARNVAAGLPPRPRKQTPGGKGTSIRFGTSIESDERLRAQLEREKYFLTVVIPRYATWRAAVSDWLRRSMRPDVYVALILVVTVHVGAAVGCHNSEGADVCAGGPVDNLDEGFLRTFRAYAFNEYGPPVLNMLATLMLSFYANVCMNLYREAYLSCQMLKEAMLDLTALAVGTTKPRAVAVRMEFWRCLNLFHVCSYVVADKARATYSFDNFLVPIATAYGPYDGRKELGMMRWRELSVLKTSAQQMRDGGYFAGRRNSRDSSAPDSADGPAPPARGASMASMLADRKRRNTDMEMAQLRQATQLQARYRLASRFDPVPCYDS